MKNSTYKAEASLSQPIISLLNLGKYLFIKYLTVFFKVVGMMIKVATTNFQSGRKKE